MWLFFIKESMKLNLHLLAALIFIAWIAWKCLSLYKDIENKQALSIQGNELKFNFMGEKIVFIDKRIDAVDKMMAEHSKEIIELKKG